MCFQELRSQFDTCLADGLSLLVTNCDVDELANDARFLNVLLQRQNFVPTKNPFKIMVSGSYEMYMAQASTAIMFVGVFISGFKLIKCYIETTLFHKIWADFLGIFYSRSFSLLNKNNNLDMD